MSNVDEGRIRPIEDVPGAQVEPSAPRTWTDGPVPIVTPTPSDDALSAKGTEPAASLGGPFEPIPVSRHDVQITGPSDNRIDVWFVGDGYTEGQLDLLLADVAAQWDWMMSDALAEPFGRYADLFNVHVVFAASPEEGADRPDEGVYVETAFGASYSWRGADAQTLYIDEFAADDAIARVLGGADVDMRFAIVNAEGYGGAAENYAVFATGGANPISLALHEAGHAFAGLADEYWDAGSGAYAGGASGASGAPNLSVNAANVPWAHWIGFDDGVLGPVGAYEGGGYAETGVFRPTDDSLMRTLGRPLDAVAREQFVLGFHDAFDPLDAWAFEGQGAVADVYDPFWTEAADEALIARAWSVDGVFVGDDDALDPVALGLAPGTYEVSVRAYDDSPYVRAGRSALEQTVTWELTQTFRAGRGTDAGDDFAGTNDPDRYEGMAGDDVLAGGAGSDLLFGGAGDDVLYGDGGAA